MSDVRKGLEDFTLVVKTTLDSVGSEMKHVKTRVEAVQLDVKNLHTPLGDILKDAKTEVTDVITRVEDVWSEVKDVKTGIKAQTAEVGSLASHMMELKANVPFMKDVLQAEKSTGPPFPESCIPYKIPHFVGRKEECQNILDQLTNGSTRLVDVCGPPGFGKTSVAIQVAHELRERKIPVYFISLHGLKTRDDLVSNLLGILVDAKQAFYVSPSDWLMQCLQKWQSPFVLILDNADDLLESGDTQVREDVLRFIEELQAKCKHIKLLVTTPESLEDLSHKLPIHPERVGVLDEASSDELVRTLLSKVSESDCNCILKKCGCVPLAMRLMCSIITEQNVSVGELLEELNDSPLVEVLDNESLTNDARLKTIINTSFQRLTTLERHAFVAIAVFPGCFSKDEARAVLNSKTVVQAGKILRSLKRKSLLDCSDDFENFTIHSLLRSFVEQRRIAEDEIKKHFAAAQLRFYDYHISNFREANEKFLTGSSNEAFEAFHSQRENIQLAIVNGSKNDDLYSKVVEALSKAELFVYAVLPCQEPLLDIYSTSIEEAKKRQRRDDECKLLAAKSFSLLGGFYSRPRSWDHSLKGGNENAENPPAKYLVYLGIHQLLSRNIEDGISSLRASADRLGSDNDERILKILACHVLAVCYRKKMDKEKASKFETLCVKECELSSCCPAFLDLFLPNNDNDATSVIEKDVFVFAVMAELLPLLYNRLEFDQQTVTELSFMTRHFKRFQNVILKLFDEGILCTRVLEACCNALFNLKCYREAAEGFQRITDKLEALESRSKSASETYFVHGSALEQLKNFKEAFHYYEKSVAIKMELLNRPEGTHDIEEIDDFVSTLLSCLKTQYLCNATAVGHPDSLKATFEELKTVVQSESLNVSSKNHDEISNRCKMFADCQFWMKDFAGALESYQQAIAITEEHDSDQVKLAACLFSKGTTHFEMENYTEAIKACQSALNLGILDGQDTANIYHKLGLSYCALNDFSKSLEGHQQALKLMKTHLGDHDLTASSLKEIGVVYFRMGRYDAAEEKLQNAADLMTEISKTEHEETANALFYLGEVYLALGKHKEACDSGKEALKIRLRLLGEHIDTAVSFHSLGSIYFEMNDVRRAVSCFQRASELKQKLLGEHLETARSHHCLGEAQMLQGNTVDAIGSLRTALSIREKNFGSHSDTAATLELLGRAFRAEGQSDSACFCTRRALEMKRQRQAEQKSHTNDNCTIM
ncbi:uncharacterized protein LOC111327429 [Stylophora pistillata]|nr:uncharacterized protein LOC111327429 [Stylophora pistillata]